MLKLHRLELSGFKSFVDQVTLDVAGGLTAIVGPNGCGKSNIADAVIWVLGERSAKSLRGEKMEDVIFAGAQNRKPLGMAQVTLELTSDNGFEGIEDGRLEIGRRVFRGGESQYFLNGKIVRLMDIKDILMDTGLGIRTYSMIEQGKIGMILSSKPQERRRLLEEAAGITRYRDRRRLAEIKLEEARANLERLEDIVSEVERSLRSLKRQASAARRYEKRQQEYKDLLRQVLEGRWFAIRGELDTVARLLDAQTSKEAELTAKLHDREAALAAAREEQEELGCRLADCHSRAAEVAATIEGRQEFLKGSRERLQEIADRIAAGRLGIETRKQQRADLRQSLDELAENASRLVTDRNEAANNLSEDEVRITKAETLVTEKEEQLEALRGRLLSSFDDLTALRNRLHTEQVESEKGQLRRRHLEEELEAKQAEHTEAGKTLAAANREVGELEGRSRDQQTEIDTLSGDLEKEEQQLDALATKRAQLEARLAGLEQKRDLLSELGLQQAERRQALAETLEAAGLEEVRFLADRLQVSGSWAASLDLFLGELAEAVILPTDADSLSLARSLVQGRGKASLLRSPRSLSAVPAVDDPAIHSSLGEALGLSKDIAAALPPAFLVEFPADTERLAREHPGIAFISRDRFWAQSGVLHVQGERDAPGLLTREEELTSVSAEIPRLEAEREGLRTDIETTEHTLEVSRGRIRQLDQNLAEVNRELAVGRARRDDLETRKRRLELESKTLEGELSNIAEELQLLGDRRVQIGDDVDHHEALHEDLETAFNRAQSEVDRTKEAREATRTSGASRRGRLELLIERVASAEKETARIQREIEDSKGHDTDFKEDEARLQERQEEIRSAMERAEEELQTALERRSSSQDEVVVAQENLDAKREKIVALEEQVEAARVALDKVRSEIGDVRVQEAGHKQNSAHLVTSFAEEFGEKPPETPREREVGLDEVEADLERCKQVLERLGPVNLLAAAEYDEHSERHEFLTEQRSDVASSVERLKETIREINQTSSERFLETFHEVNQHFRKTYVELFRGGEAEMRLLDPEDVLESVIEIVARPPGKRLQNLMLLSGGEKALTAIALLFALFHTKPSPFCILDEVDAPLDDVNTLRFVELLTKMSGETQFVVITHNKLTMEAASKLYGVTMQERGVSNIVAVELDAVQPQTTATAG